MTDLLHTLPNFPIKLYPHLIPSLEKKLITTTDLLTLDPLEIAKRAQLPLLDVRRLTSHVLASLQSQLGVIDGKEVLRRHENPANVTEASTLRQSGAIIAETWNAISTLNPDLDSVLSGGIPTTYITEVTGESGAGKTQFLLSLLLSTQLPPLHGLSRPSVYISTEHPLPTSRLDELLRTNPLFTSLPDSQKPSLSRIFSIQTPDLESQDHILAYQLPVLLQRHKIGLIVIDSIAANYRAERSSSSTSGAALGLRSAQLMKLGHQLRCLARDHDCAVVVSNQVADRFAPSSSSPGPLRNNNSSSNLFGSSPPSSSPNSNNSSQPAVQSLDAAIMPPPPTSLMHSSPSPHPAAQAFPPLKLDHQINFFSGWSSGPNSSAENKNQNPNLKTPSLGLVWSNQIACRIALVKERSFSSASAADRGMANDGTGEWAPREWRRYMRVAFCAWAAETGTGEKGREFEIWAGGLRAVGKGKEQR